MMSATTRLLYNPTSIRITAALLILIECVFSAVIIYKVAYTEIDWTAYMEQIEQINGGQTDYVKIEGGTGPLVYPGGHVAIFKVLYCLTDSGSNILTAQVIFAMLYVLTQALTLHLYVKNRVPVHYMVLLVLSKRLHSIYLLRLFNDCFCTFFTVAATVALHHDEFVLSSILFSSALSVKMNALLVLPGAAIIYYKKIKSLPRCIIKLGPPFLAVQAAVAYPFRDHLSSYLHQAFEFSRQFLYKWTVNWKLIPEEFFLSSEFSTSLLILHVSLLALYAFRQLRSKAPPNTLHIIATSNIIGVLSARSLHYQFYSWFFWTVPFLMYKGSLPFIFSQGLILAQELAWNVYPATSTSSEFVLSALAIMALENVIL